MLASQRDLFEMPREICYLNAASYSPLALRTQEAGRAAVGRKGRPWTLDASFVNAQHERARAAAARVINADPADVALVSSVSYGVATAAKLLTIARGTRVIVLENDHSSPVLEWRARADAQGFIVETIRQPPDGDWTAAVLAAIERRAAPPVGLASISSVHWSDGGLIDIEKIGTALRRQGAVFLIDATQGAGVLWTGCQTGWSRDWQPKASTSRRDSAACVYRPMSITTRPMPIAASRRWRGGSNFDVPASHRVRLIAIPHKP